MRRRDFITRVSRSTGDGRSRRAHGRGNGIGVPMDPAADDPGTECAYQGLQALGWIEGRNVDVDYRWARAKADCIDMRYAAEFAALAPDIILTSGGATLPSGCRRWAVPSRPSVGCPSPSRPPMR